MCARSTAIAFSIIAFDLGVKGAAILAALTAGAALGFLFHNFHPASVFMGDAGANLLGYLLGVAAVVGSLKTSAAVALVVPLVILAVPFLDTGFVIAKRLKYRRKPWSADANHFHHRMARIGFSQRKTVAYLYGWTLLMAGLAVSLRLILHHHHQLGWVAVVVALAVLALAASVYLIYVLEIFKFKAIRTIELRRNDPDTSEHEIDARVAEDLETDEFETRGIVPTPMENLDRRPPRTPRRHGHDRRTTRASPAGGLTRTERYGLIGVGALTALAGVARYSGGVSSVVAFAIAGLALAGGAWIVSFATEQVGHRFGPAVTGLLQATLGNLPEFFVVLFALKAGERIVAETAILGSILVNALLVLGLVIIAGARPTRRRDALCPRLPKDTATLLLITSFIIVLVRLADSANDAASHHIKTISIVGAVAILAVYGFWVRQYLSSQPPREGTGGAARVGTRASLGLLVAAGVASAFVSDWFVHALEPTIHTLDISQSFAGLVIVAIAGNAVENAVGVVLAAKGQSELAISVVKNSVAQIAAFLFPLLVLVSLLTATTLTFALAPVYTGALLGTSVIVWQITGDGEATPFEGRR